MDSAQELIQTRGFSAMSFQDIAVMVGIKKPSIIHHFPSKTDLGRAVIARYHDLFKSALVHVQEDPEKTPWDALEFYFTPYLDFGDAGNKVCLCGALAGEFMELGETMQHEVQSFFIWHEQWLERILEAGHAAGHFKLNKHTSQFARTLLSALQGALLLKRVTRDPKQLEDVMQTIRELIAPS